MKNNLIQFTVIYTILFMLLFCFCDGAIKDCCNFLMPAVLTVCIMILIRAFGK